jgi:hypothetical protein
LRLPCSQAAVLVGVDDLDADQLGGDEQRDREIADQQRPQPAHRRGALQRPAAAVPQRG